MLERLREFVLFLTHDLDEFEQFLQPCSHALQSRHHRAQFVRLRREGLASLRVLHTCVRKGMGLANEQLDLGLDGLGLPFQIRHPFLKDRGVLYLLHAALDARRAEDLGELWDQRAATSFKAIYWFLQL